ncbi:MAG: hypothetical protein LBN97_09460 [Oscillospiraceae bacterium]|jgi:hypothetical protein|nr:hypothetical protein [Oscillospiraceae bacterium]
MTSFNKSPKWAIILTVVIVVASIILVAALIILGGKETVVTVSADTIEISGIFGVTFSTSEVKSVTLLDKSMNEIGIGTRTNGYAAGNTQKGSYNSNALGKHLLYVDSSASPTILIDRGDERNIYISYKESTKTADLYYELEKVLQ